MHWSGVGVVVLNHSRGQATRLWGAQGNMAGSGRKLHPLLGWSEDASLDLEASALTLGKGGAAAPKGIWKEDHIRKSTDSLPSRLREVHPEIRIFTRGAPPFLHGSLCFYPYWQVRFCAACFHI